MADRWDNDKDVLAQVRKQIRSCFSNANLEFVRHKCEGIGQKNYAPMLQLKSSFNDMMIIANDFLVAKTCNADHIATQML